MNKKHIPPIIITLLIITILTTTGCTSTGDVITPPGIPYNLTGINQNDTLIWNSTLNLFQPGTGGGGGTTYHAGTGLNLTGTTFSINNTIWGNNLTWDGTQVHATGSLTYETDPWFNASIAATLQAIWINNWNTSYGWGNHANAGYLTVETDPVYTASNASNILGTNITNWDTAYGWGDHSGLYADTNHYHNDTYYTETETNNLLIGKADTVHYHNDTYYTESETNSLLSGKANSIHYHNDSYYLKTILDPWITNWNTSYGWGDHSIQNYLDLDTFPNTDTDSTDDFSGSYNDLINKPTNFDYDDLSDNNTDQLSEGSTNFWATLARIRSLLNGQWIHLSNITLTTNLTLGTKIITDTNITTWDNIPTYNQSLNTDDPVVFANVTTSNYYISNATQIPKWNIYVDVNNTLVWEKIV